MKLCLHLIFIYKLGVTIISVVFPACDLWFKKMELKSQRITIALGGKTGTQMCIIGFQNLFHILQHSAFNNV